MSNSSDADKYPSGEYEDGYRDGLNDRLHLFRYRNSTGYVVGYQDGKADNIGKMAAQWDTAGGNGHDW